MSLSRVLAYAGESEEALRELDLAAAVLRAARRAPCGPSAAHTPEARRMGGGAERVQARPQVDPAGG